MNYTNGMLRDDALKGKNIVVTGGGSGLGKAMTTYFLKLGAQVAITSRNIDKLETVAKELTEETGSKCVPLKCDVRHIEEVEAMRDAAIKALGPIDVLLNNAAGNFISPTERLSANAFDTIIDIVLKGTKNCTLAFGKHWIDNNEKDKSVLNIVTTYAWTGCTKCLSKSWCFSNDTLFSCRVGKIRYALQCNCTRTIPYKRCLGQIVTRRIKRKI